jgi:hypothetical protein
MKIKTTIHKCRECQTTALAPEAALCPSCKAAAAEKRKARKREKACAQYHAKPKAQKRPKSVTRPHHCAAAGCENITEGKAVYCPACGYSRRIRFQKYYRRDLLPIDEDLPPAPPTNLTWLDKFKAWAGSGMSYAEYQIMEMDMRSKAAGTMQHAASKHHIG